MSIIKRTALLTGVLSLLTACASIQTGKEAENGVRNSPMPFEKILACIAGTAPVFTVAVGDFTDDTGAYIPDGGGRQFPQGLRKMVSSALSSAGVHEVARSLAVWRVVKLERLLAKEGHLGDGKLRSARDKSGRPILSQSGSPILIPTRAVRKADVLGSTLILEGSITGFDPNQSAGGLEVNVGGASMGGRRWVGRFYSDTTFTDTVSTRVVATSTFARTIVGSELKAGLFTFNLGSLIGVNAGVINQEGLALSTRATVNMTVASLIAQVHPPAMDCLPNDLKPRHIWRTKYVPGSVAPKTVGSLPPRPKKAMLKPVMKPAKAKPKAQKKATRPAPTKRKPSVLVKPGIWKLKCESVCK